MSKKSILFICGYLNIFFRAYVSVAYNLSNGPRVILLICLKLCPYNFEKYYVVNLLIRSGLVSLKNIVLSIPLLST